MKISEAYGSYLQYCQAEKLCAPTTIVKYRDCFRSWILPWLGDSELESLNRLQILEMRKAMAQKGASISRQYSIVMSLKSFLKFSRELLGIQSLDPADIKLPNRGTPRVEYLTNDEVKEVLGAINTLVFSGIRLRALIELLLATGMRISEALSLGRESFDMDQSEVEIVGKGKRRRKVFFNARCRFWVKEYLGRRIDDHPALFVTTGYPARAFKRDDVSRFFVNLKAKVNIKKKITPHVLRHTFCTNLLFHGADITHIKDLAGHQDIQTTAKYYLGKDTTVLKRVVAQCLDYEKDSGSKTPRENLTEETPEAKIPTGIINEQNVSSRSR